MRLDVVLIWLLSGLCWISFVATARLRYGGEIDGGVQVGEPIAHGRGLQQFDRESLGNLAKELLKKRLKGRDNAKAKDLFTGQIVGGKAAQNGRFPFACSLRHRRSGAHFCGCSLIAPDVVLTAAHCVDKSNKDYSRPVVHIGRYFRTRDESGYDVARTKETQMHPRWDASSNEYDVALLFLDKNSTHTPIALPERTRGLKAGTEVTVLGWGRTSEKGSASETLQEVTLPVLKSAKCRGAYGSRITDVMFCAGNMDGGIDACQGDSGGPVVITREKEDDLLVHPLEIGVVSWGHGCARKGKPGVYVDLRRAVNWIERQLKAHEPDSVAVKTCTCSPDGLSGSVQTPRMGCQKHLQIFGDDDAFCMVTEGNDCPRATSSKAFPGAAWMLCDATDWEPTDGTDEDPADSDEPQGRGFKLQLGPLAVHFKFRGSDKDIDDPCACSQDGISGRVQTPFSGCQQHDKNDGRYDYWCVVDDPNDCSNAKPLKGFKGASWRGCKHEDNH